MHSMTEPKGKRPRTALWLSLAILSAAAAGAPVSCGGDGFTKADPGTGGTAGDASVDGAGGSGGSDASVDAPVDAGEPGIGVIGQPCEPPNSLACAGHAQKLVLYCDPTTNQWVALQSCSGQQFCDTRPGPTQGSCQDPEPLCVGLLPGATVCDGATLITCGPDLITADREECLNVCEDGACVGACQPGDARCDGLTPQTCDPKGAWLDGAPCPFVCVDGGCTGLCEPNSKRCEGDVPQTCSQEGQWQDGSPCPAICTAGACTEACTEGTVQCNGNVPQTCDASGAWEDGTPCAYVCSAGVCSGACAPGTKQCSGNVPQTCSAAGAWQSGSMCTYVCSAGDCTGTCAPGTKRCSGLTPQSCDASGQWGNGDPCTYVCASGDCAGVCVPGSKQCNGNVPQTCNNAGQWESGAACAALCTAGTCTGNCSPGTKQCNGNVPQTCSASGDWQNGAPCQYVCVNGVCGGECVPGSKECDGKNVKSCDSNGNWNVTTACPYACLAGACAGVCVPGTKQCSNNKIQTCQANGQWDAGTECATGSLCQGGLCIGAATLTPSCVNLAATCGPAGNSNCCATGQVPEGIISLGPGTSDWASVSAYALDVYEVTVGRFRKFVQAGKGTQSTAPAAGAGAHPLIPNSGWNSTWALQLSNDSDELKEQLMCDNSYGTWTATAGANESRPINCVSWYEMFAFCAWDGGRLPTEVEWHYAAAGGSQQRTYPWGTTQPDASYAVYDCLGDGSAAQVCSPADIRNVGSKSTKGDGLFTQADLAGNIYEGVLDFWANGYPQSAPCQDCANLQSATSRVMRGGCFLTGASSLYSFYRSAFSPSGRASTLGFRCARNAASTTTN